MDQNNKDVIVINYTGRKGGGALDAYEITKALMDRGERVIAIISRHIENLALWQKLDIEKLVLLDTYTTKLSFVYKTLVFPFTQKQKILEGCRGYHVKAVFCPMSTFWTVPINKVFKKAKKIVVNHDPIAHSGTSRLSAWLMERPYKGADIVVVHSRKFLAYVSSLYGDTRYLPLGRHNLYRNVQGKKQCVSYPADKVNFLFFGRITEYKGLDVLAEAMKLLNSEHKDRITLSIVGNGDFSRYQKLYDAFENVTVINRWIADEEVESVFQGENLVCVCPYKDATQSGVILVAFDYGVPVIASNSGGIEEQVVDGETGYLVTPNDAKALAKAMEKFIISGNLFSRMKQNIVSYLEDISWENTAAQLLDIMKQE